MSYLGVKFNNTIRKIAGMAIMDVAFSNTSINGVQNKVIKAKFDEVEDKLSDGYIARTVTATSTDTYKTILEKCLNGLDFNKIKYIVFGGHLYFKEENDNNIIIFTSTNVVGTSESAAYIVVFKTGIGTSGGFWLRTNSANGVLDTRTNSLVGENVVCEAHYM